MKKLLLPVFLLISLTCHAEGLPDLGDASQESLSPQQERQIGEQSMLQIRADKRYLGDAEVADYLNQLGGQLASNSSEPGLDFEFFAIDDSSINAFALPGGFIGVNTGLIMTTQSESELASVLSHEIAHVTQHHLARMVSGQKIDSLASLAIIAAAILASRSNPDAAMAGIVGAQAGAIQHQLNFTRAHEAEADRIGLGILRKSGFDVRAMPDFFERLQKATSLLEGSTPPYLRTHPLTSDRIADMANRVQQMSSHLVPSSLSYQLVRAKLLVRQKAPQEAIAYFSDALGPRKYGNPVVQRYGLVLALLQDRQLDRAAQEFAVLRKQAPANPMIATLDGRLRRAGAINDSNLAAFYRNTTQLYPHHRALAYDYAEVLLQDKRSEDALALLNQQIQIYPNDPRLYDLQARTYASLDRHQEEHHALAYNYILHGNLRGAIEQLEIARQAGTDFHELSTIDIELKQYRDILQAQSRKTPN